MLKVLKLGLIYLTIIKISLGDCELCNENETCIKGECYSTCATTTGGVVCDCFGDVCFSEKWCHKEYEKCCRTCQTDWFGVLAIILTLVAAICVAVVYGELCLVKCNNFYGPERNSPEVNSEGEMAG